MILQWIYAFKCRDGQQWSIKTKVCDYYAWSVFKSVYYMFVLPCYFTETIGFTQWLNE